MSSSYQLYGLDLSEVPFTQTQVKNIQKGVEIKILEQKQ